jgi:hypothetical protein
MARAAGGDVASNRLPSAALAAAASVYLCIVAIVNEHVPEAYMVIGMLPKNSKIAPDGANAHLLDCHPRAGRTLSRYSDAGLLPWSLPRLGRQDHDVPRTVLAGDSLCMGILAAAGKLAGHSVGTWSEWAPGSYVEHALGCARKASVLLTAASANVCSVNG